MDRLDSVGESHTGASLPKKVRKKKPLAVRAFSSVIHEAADADTDAGFPAAAGAESGPVEDMLSDISALGDTLVKSPTLEHVRRYRDRVKQFLKYVVAHVLDVEEQTSGKNILKRKKYLMVKTVDEKLETLARDFLLGQKEPLDLLARINEVSGMLIDLLR
jgi:uncharacterized protein